MAENRIEELRKQRMAKRKGAQTLEPTEEKTQREGEQEADKLLSKRSRYFRIRKKNDEDDNDQKEEVEDLDNLLSWRSKSAM